MFTEQQQKGLSFEPPTLLIKRFCKEYNTSEDEARERFEETKKFLTLCAINKGISYSPSEKIDDMWHQFILHTRDYFAFCDQLGTFIHHQPSEERQPKNYEITRKGIKEYFGAINYKYWDEKTSDCDSSSCDCCP